jgi:hypothetical protein
MSARGINFLDQWIANNVPETTKADVISVERGCMVAKMTTKVLAEFRAHFEIGGGQSRTIG